MDEKYLQELYNQLGGQVKFGKYDDFKGLMSNNADYRKQFHSTFGEKTLGGYDKFETLVKKKEDTPLQPLDGQSNLPKSKEGDVVSKDINPIQAKEESTQFLFDGNIKEKKVKAGTINYDASSLEAGNTLPAIEEKKNPFELVGQLNDLSKETKAIVGGGGTGGAGVSFTQTEEALQKSKLVNEELANIGVKDKDIAEIKNEISDLSPSVQGFKKENEDGTFSYPYSLKSLGELYAKDYIAYKTKINAVKTYDAIRNSSGTEKANEFARLQHTSNPKIDSYSGILEFVKEKEKQTKLIMQSLKGDAMDIALQRIDENSALIIDKTIPSYKEAEVYLKNRLYESQGKLTKNHLSILDDGESEFDGNLGGFNLSSIESKLDKNNPADRIAFQKYKKFVNTKEALNTSLNLDEAAINLAKLQDEHFASTVKVLEAGGERLPNSYKGRKVFEFLSDPYIIELAQTDPNFEKEYRKTYQNLYFNYPEFATADVANIISNEIEERGENNWFANVKTKSEVDKVVNKMVWDGKITEQQKAVYLKTIAPELGVGKSIARGFGHILAPAFTENSPISTPGLIDRAGEGWDNTMGGIYSSLKTISKASPGASQIETKEGVALDLYNALQKEDEMKMLSIKPKDILHEFSIASADFIPLVVSMAVGGGLLKGAGKTGEAINMAIQFAGHNAEKGLVAFPDSPLKQKMYTGAATTIDMFLGRLLPHNKALAEEVSSSLHKNITTAIKDFANGKITANTAKKTLLSTVEDIVNKKAPEIFKKNVETGLVMSAFSASHSGLDIAFGAKPSQSIEDFAAETAEAFKTGFLGNTLVAGAMAFKNTSTVKENLLKASVNPKFYKDLIIEQSLKSPEIATQKEEMIANIDAAVEARRVAESKGMNEKQTSNFVLLHVNQKIQENIAKNSTVDLVKEEATKKAKELKEQKEKVFKGIEEVDTQVSVPIEGADGQGVLVGNDVPAPTNPIVEVVGQTPTASNVESTGKTFEDAKEGDVITHNGKEVTIVSKGKSRGGADIVWVKQNPKTKAEIKADALQNVFNKVADEYKKLNPTWADIEANHPSEVRAEIERLTALENSRTATYTIDAEQWNNEVKSESLLPKKETPTALRDVKDAEYNDFIDKGKVTTERLNDIAQKVKYNKKLSDREMEIFSDKTSDINKIIASESLLSKEQTTPTGRDVESTAKALETVDNGDLEKALGEKLIHHGTGSDFSVLEESKQNSATGHGDFGKGFYFSLHKGNARYYSLKFDKAVRRVKSFIYSISSPFEINITNEVFDNNTKEALKKLKGLQSYEKDAILKNLDKDFGYKAITKEIGDARFSDILKTNGFDAVWINRTLGGETQKGAEIVIFNKDNVTELTNKTISEAYHQAKKNGNNPELVKAVESLLSKEKPSQKGSAEGVDSGVGENKKYLAKSGDSPDVKTHNIDTAKSLLSDLGVEASFSGYSNTNGVSVYFTDANGKKIRVSNHSVTSKERMDNEVLLSFDTKTLGLGGKEGFKSYAEQNKKEVEQSLPTQEVKVIEKKNTGTEIEPELGEGRRVVTLSGSTETERQSAIEQRKKETKQTPMTSDRDSILERIAKYNKLSRAQKRTAYGEANSIKLAIDSFNKKHEQKHSITTNRSGDLEFRNNPTEKRPIGRPLKNTLKGEESSIIDNGKPLMERSNDTKKIFNDLLDADVLPVSRRVNGEKMSEAEHDATIQDIMEGIPSQRAENYLNSLEKQIKEDNFDFGNPDKNARTTLNEALGITVESGEQMTVEAIEKWLKDESELTPENEVLFDNIDNLITHYEQLHESRVGDKVQQSDKTRKGTDSGENKQDGKTEGENGGNKPTEKIDAESVTPIEGGGGGKEPPKNTVDIFGEGEDATNNKKELDTMMVNIPNGGEVGKYLSGDTILKNEKDTELRNSQDMIKQELDQALIHGVEIIEKTKEMFGDDYVTKTLDYIENGSFNPANKALAYISLENEMAKRLLTEPNNLGLKKLQDLVRAKRQAYARSNSLALNMNRLGKFAELGYDLRNLTEGFFTSKQKENRATIEKLVQADADTIQKQYEENIQLEENGKDELENKIKEGAEKLRAAERKAERTSRKEKVHKAIDAITDKWIKKLSGKGIEGLDIKASGITAEKALKSVAAIMKKAYDAGETISSVIQKGVDYVSEKLGKDIWDKIDKEEFKKDYEEQILSGKEIDYEAQQKRHNAKEYKMLETERNRQLARVTDLNERLKTLQSGERPVTNPKEAKPDTPEIEALKQKVKEETQKLNSIEAQQKRVEDLEVELDRLQNRLPKDKKETSKREVSEKEQELKDKIDEEKALIRKENKENNELRLSDAKEAVRQRIEKIKAEILAKEREIKEEGKKLDEDLELQRLKEIEKSITELRDKYLPEEKDPYEVEKQREKVKDKLVSDIIDLNEQINARKRTPKTEKTDYSNDAEISKLTKIKEAKKAILNEIDPLATPKEKTTAERTAEAEQRVQERIDAVREEIKNGELELKKAKDKKLQSKKLEQLKAQEQALIALRDRYLPKGKDPYANEKLAKTIEKKLIQENIELNRQIAKGEKDVAEGKTTIESEKLNKLKAERDARKEILEAIDPTPKIYVENALIEQGFGKIIKVKTKNGVKERQVLDWKKFAGAEGTVTKISENVAKSLEKSGFTPEQLERMSDAFIEEYTNIRKDVIEKGQNEIAARNKTVVTPEQKSAAKKLSEMYNYGLFEKDLSGFEVALAKTIGINELTPQRVKNMEKIGEALQVLYNTKHDGVKLTEFQVKSAIQHIQELVRQETHDQLNDFKFTTDGKFDMEKLAYKATDLMGTYMDLAQRNALISVKQTLENPWSGKVESIFSKLAYTLGSPKELRKQRRKAASDLFKEMVMGKGSPFGEVTSTFVNRGNVEMELNKMSDSKLFHTVASTFIGKTTLDAVDSRFKSSITNQKFTYNLLKILTKDRIINNKVVKGMSKIDARNYVAEKLTGQSFEAAQKTAKEIIDKINKDAGKKMFNDSPLFVDRLANDIVNASLVNGSELTAEMVEASYNASYRAAGRGLGHVANNYLSKMIANHTGKIETQIRQAVKEKNFIAAAGYKLESMLFRNVLNPYVGGGTNWTLLRIEKSGLGLLSGVGSMIRDKNSRKIDLTSETGIKNLEQAMYLNMKIRDKFTRSIIGGSVGLLSALITGLIVDEESYFKWRKNNYWASKYTDIFLPEVGLYFIARKTNTEMQYAKQALNQNDQFDKGKIAFDALSYAIKGKSEEALGKVGQLNPLGAPVPWRLIRDGDQIITGINGGEPYRVTNDIPQTIMQGGMKGGMFDYFGVAPHSGVYKKPTKKYPLVR
jgi:hypothetical protein